MIAVITLMKNPVFAVISQRSVILNQACAIGIKTKMTSSIGHNQEVAPLHMTLDLALIIQRSKAENMKITLSAK